jgi:hypothetical protein
MTGGCLIAAAILERNFVHAIGVDDNQQALTRSGIRAVHGGVVELDFEAERLQRYILK